MITAVKVQVEQTRDGLTPPVAWMVEKAGLVGTKNFDAIRKILKTFEDNLIYPFDKIVQKWSLKVNAIGIIL